MSAHENGAHLEINVDDDYIRLLLFMGRSVFRTLGPLNPRSNKEGES